MPQLLWTQSCRNPTAASPCSSTPTRQRSSIRTPTLLWNIECLCSCLCEKSLVLIIFKSAFQVSCWCICLIITSNVCVLKNGILGNINFGFNLRKVSQQYGALLKWRVSKGLWTSTRDQFSLYLVCYFLKSFVFIFFNNTDVSNILYILIFIVYSFIEYKVIESWLCTCHYAFKWR